MKRSENETYHDRIAPRYDDIHETDAYHSFCREISHRHLRPHLPRDLATRVLDAGCGTGLFGARLAKSGYRVDFLDLSIKMLDRARGRYQSIGHSYEPRFVHADLEQPDGLEPGAYGLILVQGDVLSFVAKPKRAVRALSRLTQPGGVVCASVDQRYAGLGFYLDKSDLDGLATFVQKGRSVWLGGTREERFPLTMFTPKDLRGLFEGVGFEVISMIGKTVLPLRKRREMLEDPRARRRLLQIEEKLHRDEATLGMAAHLEILARRPSD